MNGSPFDWTLSGQHSYQMDAWNWPAVRAGKNLFCSHMYPNAEHMQEQLQGFMLSLGLRATLATMLEVGVPCV